MLSRAFLRRVGTCVLALACWLVPQRGAADVVVPTDRVTRWVNIRDQPTTESQILGRLEPGDRLEHLGSVPFWHQVLLENGQVGFVSTGWTNVVHDAPPMDDDRGSPDELEEVNDVLVPVEVTASTAAQPQAGGMFDFWLSESLVRKLATENTLMFPMNVNILHRSGLKSLSQDCEMHIAGTPVDAEDLAGPPSVVIEPPNLCQNDPPTDGNWANFVDAHLLGNTCTVFGFPRIYDEHLVGEETATNPHHMLEIHPAMRVECGGVTLDASTFLAYHEGMREIAASSAARCFETRVWVRRNATHQRYEFTVQRHPHCGNFASFELSVFDEWIRELSTGGHSALVRVRAEGLGMRPLKIYTYAGTEADDLIHGFEQSPDPHDGTFLHGMMTIDYFSIIKVVRDSAGSFLDLPQWTEVPFPLSLVAFGVKEDPDPEEHD